MAIIKIDNFIETSVSKRRPIPVSVLREKIVFNYPYWATRELLMNAIMHRDYETNAPVQFYEYEDRIEIQNPGGLYGKARPENFPNVNDYRNPFIAEAMKVMGYVNRFSRGVSRVQKELLENGNGEALFDLSLITAFKVIENISTKHAEFGMSDEGHFAQENAQEITKRPRKEKATQETIQEKIVATLRVNPTITRSELASLLKRTQGSIKYHLSQLSHKGVVEHLGSTKSGKWIVF
ncbi:hypothetical protein AwDysgo_14760 [Bacteroidales bacterium]|nr:hypothetical protein AwDysgo_14760 [Bacteroidales bacterium]